MTTLRSTLILALWIASQSAATETARDILDRRKQFDETTQRWDDRRQQMTLTVFDRRGSERVREIELYERKDATGDIKSLVFFLAPAEVKGTGFLAFTHKGHPADQWLYLPEIKRVRQITSNSRNESFVGTDLTYHDLDLLNDMVRWSEEDAGSVLKGEETEGSVPCHVIELSPKRADVSYDRIVLWLDREHLVPRRVEFYAGPGEPRKRMRQTQVQLLGSVPIAHRAVVETPTAGTRTEIAVTDVKLNQQLDDGFFSQRSLERGTR